ncbi:MAG: tetratricopeptide repeat protein [Spirochaetaceae bacterium]|nr:tetratricopeptide repeat protein [Spirochaetaceae bacterium]MCF7950749.1 tetratricopeptide repeat protein [Spirochaetaceae bacterium]
MGCRIQKLMAGSCIWMLLGCSPSFSSDSVPMKSPQPQEGVFDERLESGKRHFFAGRYAKALSIWEESEIQFPYGFRMDKWKARALLMENHPELAYELLCPYLQIIPEHPELLLLLGKCRFEQGNYTEAVELLEWGAGCVTGIAGIYLTRAEMYYHIGLHSKAGEFRQIAQRLLNLERKNEITTPSP